MAEKPVKSYLTGAIHNQVSVLKGEGCDGTEVFQVEFTSPGGVTLVVLSLQAMVALRKQMTKLGLEG